MKVRILVEAPYADFEKKRGKVGAQKLEVGHEIDYPDKYAEFLIGQKLAEAVKEKPGATPLEDQPEVSHQAKIEEKDAKRHGPSVSAADEEGLEKAGITRPKRGSRK
jgi:hypothetical protein